MTSHHTEHPPTTIRQYVMIGVILTIITILELWLSYSGLPDGVLIAGLLIMSAVKFAAVVALFMHLRYEHPLFTRLFVFGLVLAGTLLFAVVSLFAFDHWDSSNVPGRGEAVPHAEAEAAGDHGEGGASGEAAATPSEGDGGAEPAGDPAAGMVQGLPVAEFFQGNCAVCHGQNREGLVGPALTPERLTESDEFYFNTIQNGREGTAMPAWGGQLNEDDINALVQFIKHVEP